MFIERERRGERKKAGYGKKERKRKGKKTRKKGKKEGKKERLIKNRKRSFAIVVTEHRVCCPWLGKILVWKI